MSDMSEAPNLSDAAPLPTTANFDLLSGITVRVSVEVGSTQRSLADLLALQEGGVVELDRQSDELLELFANGTRIARGEIVEVDGRYALRIVEVAAADRRLAGLERRI
jgi:flagellar motor switch protein FliN